MSKRMTSTVYGTYGGKTDLHFLQVKWATKNLKLIDNVIERLAKESDIGLNLVIEAIQAQRQGLIDANQAYADAQLILDELKHAELGEL